eukprot:2978516-Prorocentrum_lima.AAC.1
MQWQTSAHIHRRWESSSCSHVDMRIRLPHSIWNCRCSTRSPQQKSTYLVGDPPVHQRDRQ